MFYPNTTREVEIGDEIRCQGTCDTRILDGCRAIVIGIPEGSPHALHCRIYEECGTHYTWYIYEHNVAGPWTSFSDGHCPMCGAELKRNNVLGKHLFKRIICDKCVTRAIGKVESYHFGKNLRYNVDPDKITFGWECEIDAPYDFDYDERNDLVRDCIAYAKRKDYPLIHSYERDGSLRDGGVECVSAPLTISDIGRDYVKNQLKYLFERADEIGFNFDDENHAGLHVHIGRKSLCGDRREISDAVGLLMGWAVTRLWNKGFEDLSRRTDLDYCHLSDYEHDGNGLDDTNAVYDRYYCVNIQNDKTIELRIFNNARSYEDVVVAVDVCYMLAKWATKKINAFMKRNSYSAKSLKFTDALCYADRLGWDALVKYSKFPEITLPRMRSCGIDV